MQRVLAFMTYLNDVEEGGETSFHYYDINVQPKKGKTMIWPAEWTQRSFWRTCMLYCDGIQFAFKIIFSNFFTKKNESKKIFIIDFKLFIK